MFEEQKVNQMVIKKFFNLASLLKINDQWTFPS